MTKSEATQVASVAIFNADGELLFGKRNDNGLFTLPGGHLDDGEEPYAGAVRELKEETGIEASLDTLGSEVITGRDGKKVEVHAFVGMCDDEEASSHADPDDECSEWRWVDVSDGLPEEIAGNLHSPKNVTLRLLDLQDEDLQKGLREKLGAAALTAGLGFGVGSGLVTGNSPGQPRHSAPVTVQAPQPAIHQPSPAPAAWSTEGLHPDLKTIAHLESSGNHDIVHEAHSKGDFHTAFGALGFKPSSGFEQYQRSATLKNKFPQLDQDSFTEKFKADPKFYNAVASDHWGWLKQKLKTPARTAFAWRFGRGAALSADDHEIDNAGYVRAFRNAPLAKAEPHNTPEFHEWFSGSVAVHPDGKPKTFYHGTSKDTDFSSFKIGQRGSWFTTDPKEASMYAKDNDSRGLKYEGGQFVEKNNAPRVIPVHLAIKNPYKYTAEDHAQVQAAKSYQQGQRLVFEKARIKGHDGVDLGNGVLVAFHPHQIKSIFNAHPTTHNHLMKMALADIGRGRMATAASGGGTRYDYSHVLPQNGIKNVTMSVTETPGEGVRHTDSRTPALAGGIHLKCIVDNPASMGSMGQVTAVFYPKNKRVVLDESHLGKKHRGKGYGRAMYEALLAHAKNHLGAETAAGGTHSTMASRVHASLAEKHGMNYVAKVHEDMEDVEPGELDDRMEPYRYTLKAEVPMTKTSSESADVFLALQHDDPVEHRLAQSMRGFGPEHVSWAIHHQDKSGQPVLNSLDHKRVLNVLNAQVWTDLLTTAPLNTVLGMVSDPQGLASIVRFLNEPAVSKALTDRLLEVSPEEGQELMDIVLPAADPEVVKLVYRAIAETSPRDVPDEHNRLLLLMQRAPEIVQEQIPGDVFKRMWETLILPRKAWHLLPSAAPLLPDDQEEILADFDKSRGADSEALINLARMKSLGPSIVKGILDRLPKLPADVRWHIGQTLASAGHISDEDADSHAMLASTPMAKSEAVRDGLRRLPPGLYRLYRCACAVFGVWPAADDAEILKLRAAAWMNDGDLTATALAAVDQPDNPENREILQAAADMMPLVKAEGAPMRSDAAVKALSSSAFDVAEDIANNLDTSRAAHLDGKHSKGSFFVDTPSATWFMKPGAGGTGPIEGVHDDPAPPSAREAAFWSVAQDWGLSDDLTRAEWVSVDGHAYSAIKFLPDTYKPLINEMEKDPGRYSAALEAYRHRGRLWQWAVLDWVLGNGDRHGHNMLATEKGEIRLIDHGSSFAGVHFNPGFDVEAFVPYYLRYTAPKDVVFNTLRPSEKLRYMPDIPMAAQNRLRGWVMSLDETQLTRSMERFGIVPHPTLQRLARVKEVGQDLSGYVNRLWAGF